MTPTNQECPVIALYRIPEKSVVAFSELIEQHAPLLQKLGLSSGEYRLFIKPDSEFTTYIEIFSWTNENSADIAHNIPEVNILWSALEDLCETYNGLRRAEFWHVKAVV